MDQRPSAAGPPTEATAGSGWRLLVAGGGWWLVVGGWWWVGGWRWVVAGGWWWPVAGGWWLVVAGGWLVVGGWPWLALRSYGPLEGIPQRGIPERGQQAVLSQGSQGLRASRGQPQDFLLDPRLRGSRRNVSKLPFLLDLRVSGPAARCLWSYGPSLWRRSLLRLHKEAQQAGPPYGGP